MEDCLCYFKCYSRQMDSFNRKFCICFLFYGLFVTENGHIARVEDSIWKMVKKGENEMLQVGLGDLSL